MTEPNLRFPAVFCENLRFSAKICGFLRFPAPSKCVNFQEEGRICENLRFSAKICVLGSICHLSSVPLSAPRQTTTQNHSLQASCFIRHVSGQTCKMFKCSFCFRFQTSLATRVPVSAAITEPLVRTTDYNLKQIFGRRTFYRY